MRYTRPRRDDLDWEHWVETRQNRVSATSVTTPFQRLSQRHLGDYRTTLGRNLRTTIEMGATMRGLQDPQIYLLAALIVTIGFSSKTCTCQLEALRICESPFYL